MQPFVKHRGIAAPLLQPNIDTDAIIPSREMRRVSRRGLGDALFANWRYLEPASRTVDPSFVLNQPAYAGASILLTLENFGCGSSREFAVWALVDFGVRAIIAPSFGAIFARNCVANGILPAVVPVASVHEVAAWVEVAPKERPVMVNLQQQTLELDRHQYSFEVAASDRAMLLAGLDAVDDSLQHLDEIEAFEARHFASSPWVKLRSGSSDSSPRMT